MKLEPGDEVIQAVYYEGAVLVFTKYGHVWQVKVDYVTQRLEIRKLAGN